MRVAALIAMLVLYTGAASAHGGPVPVQPAGLWQAWSFDPLVIVPLAIAHWVYGRGVLRLWARAGRGRGLRPIHIFSFLLGETAIVVALLSPLDQLGGTLLSAHMAQHAILIAVAPPLLLAGKPGVAFAWALPDGWSRGSNLAVVAWRPLARLGRALSRPLSASVLQGIALWAWHAPGAFDGAVGSEWLHALEHASFLGAALLFWSAVLGARSSRRAGLALGAAFFTLVHGGLLGALMTLSPRPFYGWYGDRTELWGLSPLEDQQLAGLLMWVPMGIVYLGACLLLARRLVTPEDRRPPRSSQGDAVPIQRPRSSRNIAAIMRRA